MCFPQLFEALVDLKSVNILHADIKPDNVMLVDREHQPHRIKLIDFGWAYFGTDISVGMNCQAPSFRYVTPNLLIHSLV